MLRFWKKYKILSTKDIQDFQRIHAITLDEVNSLRKQKNKLNVQLATVREQREAQKKKNLTLEDKLRVVRISQKKSQDILSATKLLYENNLVNTIGSGFSFKESAVRYSREEVKKKNKQSLRSFSHSLMKDKETKETGILCSAIHAYYDSFLPLALKLFTELSNFTDLHQYVPVEYFHVLYLEDKDAAFKFLNEDMYKNMDILSKYGYLQILIKLKELSKAFILFKDINLDEFKDQLSKSDYKSFQHLNNMLVQWNENNSRKQKISTNENISFAFLDYKMLDYNRTSSNIGDYIQTLAMMSNLVRFTDLEFEGDMNLVDFTNKIQAQISQNKQIEGYKQTVNIDTINRDFSHLNKYEKITWAIVYGWYMHPNFKSYFDFPLADNIRPIFISFHINNKSFLDEKSVKYLKRYEPIGCRDWSTVYLLRELNIKAFFSGCITTTVGKLYSPRSENGGKRKTALVEYKLTGNECINDELVEFTHAEQDIRNASFVANMKHADDILETYSKYDHIATSRLHCYLPCTAIGLDVTFKPKNFSDIRFEGLLNINQNNISQMRSNIEDKLESIFKEILSNPKEEDVYAKWIQLCEDDLKIAEKYCITYNDVPKPMFNIGDTIHRLKETSFRYNAEKICDIEISFAVDKNLKDELLVVIESILTNTEKPCSFHIMTRELTREYWDMLCLLFPEAKFTFYNFDVVSYGDDIKLLSHISVSTMDRLLLPELLFNLDKVIYLDIDIVVLGDISELWDIELGTNALAGKNSSFESLKYGYNMVYRASLSLDSEKSWQLRRSLHDKGNLLFNAFNAGVLVMNLRKMRLDNFSENYIPYIEQFKMNDQDVLNIYARESKVSLDIKWNAVPSQDITTDAKILHYAGPIKPWADSYITREEEFLSYKSVVQKRIKDLNL
jgi:lipopolysaccharide biosynthesis glycosyltransferase